MDSAHFTEGRASMTKLYALKYFPRRNKELKCQPFQQMVDSNGLKGERLGNVLVRIDLFLQ